MLDETVIVDVCVVVRRGLMAVVFVFVSLLELLVLLPPLLELLPEVRLWVACAEK